MERKSRDLERPAQSPAASPAGSPAQTVTGRSSDAPAPGSVASHPAPGRPSRRRVWAARILALVADGTQIALLPLVLGGAVSPLNDVIDIVMAVALTGLIGFHWAFLPTFIAEILPFVDLVPSWTLAVFFATRGQGRRREPVA